MHILPPMVQCITHDACEETSFVLESRRNHFPGAITSMGEEILQHYQNHLFLGYCIAMVYIVDIQSFKRDG